MVVALTGLAILVSACSHASGTPHSTGSTTTSGPHRSTTTTGPTTTTTSTPSTTSTTTSATSIGTLTTRTQPAGNYTVSLPAAWVFSDTSVPSDHQNNTWSDPSDPHASLAVVLSGCEGCVKTSLTSSAPDPTKVLPAGATVTQTVAPWQVFYTNAATPSGYEDFGMIDVTHNGTAVTGYVMLDLVVPAADAASAATVLGSFTLSG
jgi:hypothetical protein